MNKKVAIVLGVVMTAGLLVVGLAIFGAYRYFKGNMENTHIFIEDLHSGAVRKITHSGLNTFPRFSSDGREVYYLTRSQSTSGHSAVKFVQFGLHENKVMNVVMTAAEDTQLTSYRTEDGRILCYLRKNGETELCLFNPRENQTRILTHDGGIKSDVSLSPDGQWIAYIRKNPTGASGDILVVSIGGDRQLQLSHTQTFLEKPSAYTWMPDSKSVAYISFLQLVVKSIDGSVSDTIDLSGLVNFKALLVNPVNPDRLVVAARKADGGLSFSLFEISRKQRTLVTVREGRQFWEFAYSFSPDGSSLVYSAASN